jgi:hypothetical protein
MIHQVTLQIPDALYQPLLEKAKATGQTVEAVASACLQELVAPQGAGFRLKHWAGALASDVPDAALRHDEYLGQALDEELRGKPDA